MAMRKITAEQWRNAELRLLNAMVKEQERELRDQDDDFLAKANDLLDDLYYDDRFTNEYYQIIELAETKGC